MNSVHASPIISTSNKRGTDQRHCLHAEYIEADGLTGLWIKLGPPRQSQNPSLQANVQGGDSPQLYYHYCSGRIPGHTTRAPQVGFHTDFFEAKTVDWTAATSCSGANLVNSQLETQSRIVSFDPIHHCRVDG